MKVLFLASYFPKPDNDVMGTWALSQAQALVRQGVDLQVISFTSVLPQWIALSEGAKAYANCPEEYCWPGGVNVQYPRWLYYPIAPLKEPAYRNPYFYMKMAWMSAKGQLTKAIRVYKPDVIFCHHSLPNGWLAAQSEEVKPIPLIVLEHDYDEISDCHRYPRRKEIMQQVAQQADRMLGVSCRMEEDIRQLFPQASTATLHNGVTLPPAEVKDRPRPVELADRKIVLTCALFAERKGIPLLIEAFHKIAHRHPKALVRIAGAGPDWEKIEQTIKRLKMQSQVQLLGRLPHRQVLQEMAWSDCFALVGWDEPFATVYLEAMAAGKPIICCSDGGITDVVEDNVHGCVVLPKDVDAAAAALDHLLSDEVSRARMGKNARQLIEDYLSWDAKAAELIQLFEKTLQQRKERSIVSQKEVPQVA